MSTPHKHSTPDGNTITHEHERGTEIHHHGWHRATDPQPDGSKPLIPWIAADEGYFFDDLTDWKGEKRRHTSEVIGMQRVFEIPVVMVMTGFDNEYDAAAEALEQMGNVPSGQSPVDTWDLPANLDLTGSDGRAGTIVYGADNALIVRALAKLKAFVDPNEDNGKEGKTVDDIDRLIGYLSLYTFDGA